MDHIKLDSEVQVTITKPKRIIYFSDGVEEEIEEEKENELQNVPETEQNVDPKNLSWGLWLSHYAWKSGSSVLHAVDYAGETLADFFNITTPKYQIEIAEYERMEEEKRKMEEESAGWIPSNLGGEVPLVLREPSKVIKESDMV